MYPTPRKVQAVTVIKDPSIRNVGGKRKWQSDSDNVDGDDSRTRLTEMKGVKPKEITNLLHEIYEIEGEKQVGRDQKRYQLQRAVSLGMHLKKEKIPRKIRKGMQAKHEERLEKALQEEKDLGIFNERKGLKVSLARLTSKVLDGRSATSTSRAVAQSILKEKTKKEHRERGVTIKTGNFKHGTLFLSKNEISRVQGKK